MPMGECRSQKMGAVRGSGVCRGGFWTMSMPSGWATSTTASPYPMNRCFSPNPPVARTLYGCQPSFNPDASTVVLHMLYAVRKAHTTQQVARLRGLLVLHLACACLSAVKACMLLRAVKPRGAAGTIMTKTIALAST